MAKIAESVRLKQSTTCPCGEGSANRSHVSHHEVTCPAHLVPHHDRSCVVSAVAPGRWRVGRLERPAVSDCTSAEAICGAVWNFEVKTQHCVCVSVALSNTEPSATWIDVEPSPSMRSRCALTRTTMTFACHSQILPVFNAHRHGSGQRRENRPPAPISNPLLLIITRQEQLLSAALVSSRLHRCQSLSIMKSTTPWRFCG